MLVVTREPNQEKQDLTLLVAALEDAVDEVDLRTVDEDTLRGLEMRLATITGAIGIERMVKLDPFREERTGDEFGDAHVR